MKPKSKIAKVLISLAIFIFLLIALIFADLVPIGYKHIEVPQDIVFSGTQEAKYLPKHTCPPERGPTVKLNYHVPGELQLYNMPVYASICPAHSFTMLLYW